MSATPVPHVTTTKLDNDSTTDVKVAGKRTVTYVFHATSAPSLSIPYAVQVAGKVPAAFKDRPKRVSGKGGKIVVTDVSPGETVALFLNSDAHPSYRRNPVYQVTASSKDVTVTINEKSGKHRETDTPTPVESGPEADALDHYTSVLTGDIWMRISHRYTADEVESLTPPRTDPLVVSAIKTIYTGLTQPNLSVEVAASGAKAIRRVCLRFTDGDNPKTNISSGYDLLREGLTRVHPAGYAAVITAALEAGIDELTLTSAWRPMLGSIAHRAGLGLDVSHISKIPLNRKLLANPKERDMGTVSDEEIKRYRAMLDARARQLASQERLTSARKALARGNDDSVPLAVLKQNLRNAEEEDQAARNLLKQAQISWSEERDRLEPQEVRRFRAELIKCSSVSQVFDPWFMDVNIRDNDPGTSNQQLNDNEKLHADHLHITIHEPKIL